MRSTGMNGGQCRAEVSAGLRRQCAATMIATDNVRMRLPNADAKIVDCVMGQCVAEGLQDFGAGKEKRPDKHRLSGLYILVPEIGVEPTTFALRMRCSTN